MTSPRDERPLTSAAFHILLALTDADLHGLGIAAKIEDATSGDLEMGPGTLYRSLKQLLVEGAIRETHAPDGDADPRRRHYRITAAGRARAAAEAARLERVVSVARERRLLPKRG